MIPDSSLGAINNVDDEEFPVPRPPLNSSLMVDRALETYYMGA